jgi:Zn finger protein HypA/HybF involved in hydrogenase expression
MTLVKCTCKECGQEFENDVFWIKTSHMKICQKCKDIKMKIYQEKRRRLRNAKKRN